MIVPYNRPDLLKEAFRQHGPELAAVLCEPIYFNAGCVLPTTEFMACLRRLTQQQGTLLIFDEVLSAFRMALGGAQEYLGVTPDQGAAYAAALAGTNGLHPMADNHVPSYFLFNLNGTYSFENVQGMKGLQLFAQINNVFNRTPPFAVGGGAFGAGNNYGGTNPIFFDTLGLAWRAGFRLTF